MVANGKEYKQRYNKKEHHGKSSIAGSLFAGFHFHLKGFIAIYLREYKIGKTFIHNSQRMIVYQYAFIKQAQNPIHIYRIQESVFSDIIDYISLIFRKGIPYTS